MRVRRLLAVALTAALLLVAIVFWTTSGSAEPPPKEPATDAQVTEFQTLHQRYRKIVFDALVTGDVSLFPTIFYNDPSVDLAKYAPDCIPLIKEHRAAVTAALSVAQAGPVGSGHGILSCSLADNLNYQRDVSAWDAAKSQAAAQGRTATSADLPAGAEPRERVSSSDWVDVTSYVVDADIQGDYATVDYAFDESGGGWHEHMLLKQITGNWYIVAIWNSGNP